MPRARQALREDESWVEFNLGISQQGKELLLKGPPAMVLLLAGNVGNDCLPPRLTDTERAVTALPGKSVRVSRMRTYFGDLSFNVTAGADGQTMTGEVNTPGGAGCRSRATPDGGARWCTGRH